jgi:hypothetical protein
MSKTEQDFDHVLQQIAAGEATDRTALANMLVIFAAATAALGTAVTLVI